MAKRCSCSIAARSRARNGGRPVSSAYITPARLYWSARAVTGVPAACSGRHVVGRAEHAPRDGDAGRAEHTGDAEVGQLRLTPVGEQDVGRLDVAVDHAVVVRVLQRAADLQSDLTSLPPIEPPAVLQLLLETRALDEFHRVEERALFLAVAVQAHDAGVAERLAAIRPPPRKRSRNPSAAARCGLSTFTATTSWVSLVHRTIDRPHAAFAERFADLVGAELLLHGGAWRT